GLNCSMGVEAMLPPLRRLAEYTSKYVSVHPNAGLPNQMGQYDDSPEKMATAMDIIVKSRIANIIGGCCGTTPEHIKAFRAVIDNVHTQPRNPNSHNYAFSFSGLEPTNVPNGVFVNIGERCNVAGSRKFLRLIKEKQYEEAISIAKQQVEDGAMMIDINMDDGMLDAPSEMTTFLNLISTEPEVAKVPVMIDSSRFEVIEAGLKCLQGKGVVNSISLKDGEESFIARAKKIAELGAAVIVMAFDEKGQATSYERRIEVCQRSYNLLTGIGYSPSDIIFDPNILTVATGMDEHLDYAYDFIRATKWIRENLPGCGVCGGVSNLSFAFRGNNPLREAMHAVFLYHAMNAGMTMAIMNPATTVSYEEIEPDLRNAIEDVLFNERTAESVERLASLGQEMKAENKEIQQEASNEKLPLDQRLANALVKGDASQLPNDLQEALTAYSNPVDIISGPLMTGMNRVGTLFGEGKVFLPQVVKTARTMKQAVDFLKPYIEQNLSSGSEPSYAGKVVLATVKGDVHDIGKNIVGVILACNSFNIVDLGVMVTPEAIIE
ncbi:MAG: dihydropteroate synthase, partial [Bacteroidaceae bacterium]|nr:dihydropteroate synthase [Bacteroidaceae bacterium]